MISVVIPVLDEAEQLPGCLDDVLRRTRGVDAEVIVVDGGSTDGSLQLAAARAGVRVVRSRPGRGSQMNAGAREARGSLLVFLPADTRLPDGALDALATADRNCDPVAGGFRQRFDKRRPVLRVVSWATNVRARLTRIFYGDQVPFIRRDLFLAMGGYREDIDMEDIELGSRLRRVVRPGRLEYTVTTSSRRFDRAGDLTATLAVLRVLLIWTLFRRIPRSKSFFTPVR